MRRSQFFLPVLRDAPASAQITSHRLMLRAGMIQQSSAGIYSWLPLGLRVLKKVETIIREEQDRAGAQEIMMPILQPADIWRESGRYEAYGDEMFRLDDRGGRNMLLAPTHEEVVTDIARAHIQSHRDLPRMLYQVHWKFRDERRPRFGVMRGREFLMKDTYSFDLDYDAARASYRRMFFAYLRTFARMGLDVIPARADPGPIGGDLSHEFILLAENGESDVFFDKHWLAQKAAMPAQGEDSAEEFDALTGRYAATDEMHEKLDAPEGMEQKRGIEIGHIFYFGTKYSKAMDATVTDDQGRDVPLEMGSYGIGVSRLPGAIAEASHDDDGLIWPASVAPFDVVLIDLNAAQESDVFYARLKNAGFDVLYDDREISAGQKFAEADLIGVPWQVVVSPRGLKKGQVELKHRQSGERFYLSPEDALERIDLDRGLV